MRVYEGTTVSEYGKPRNKYYKEFTSTMLRKSLHCQRGRTRAVPEVCFDFHYIKISVQTFLFSLSLNVQILFIIINYDFESLYDWTK